MSLSIIFTWENVFNSTIDKSDIYLSICFVAGARGIWAPQSLEKNRGRWTREGPGTCKIESIAQRRDAEGLHV